MMIRHEHAMQCDMTLHTQPDPMIDMINDMMMLVVLPTGVSKRLDSR